MVLALLLTASVLLIIAFALVRHRRPVTVEPARTAPGAPVAAGAPGAAPRRRPANNAAGHFAPYTRTSGKNAPTSRRTLSHRRRA